MVLSDSRADREKNKFEDVEFGGSASVRVTQRNTVLTTLFSGTTTPGTSSVANIRESNKTSIYLTSGGSAAVETQVSLDNINWLTNDDIWVDNTSGTVTQEIGNTSLLNNRKLGYVRVLLKDVANGAWTVKVLSGS